MLLELIGGGMSLRATITLKKINRKLSIRTELGSTACCVPRALQGAVSTIDGA